MSASVIVYSIIASFICSPVGTNKHVVKIGYFTEADRLEYGGRVNIDKSDINSISLVKTVNCEFSFYDNAPHYTYYYNTSPGEGKIKKIREIRNDVDSLIYIIDQRQKNNQLKPNAVFGYIRSFNSRYSDKKWLTVCGSVDKDRIKKLDTDLTTNLLYPSYFGSFLSKDRIDRNYHKDCVPKWNSLELINPDDPNPESEEEKDYGIDLIHRGGVMDGVYKCTHSLITDSVYRAVVSWAGDLQTFAQKHNSSIKITEDILFDQNHEFSHSDLYADLDGFNIVTGRNEASSVSEHRTTYYQRRRNDYKYRYSRFRINTVRDYYENPSDWVSRLASYFEKMVFDRMAIQLSDDGSRKDCPTGHPIKYHFLQNEYSDNAVSVSSDNLAPYEVRKQAATTFTKYILRRANQEEQIPL